MKRILLLAALSLGLLAAPLQNDVSAQDASNELCGALGELAETILDQRYQGVPLSEMRARLEGAAEGDADMAVLLDRIVTEAYLLPQLSSAELQMYQRFEFRNQIELLCFEAVQ